MKMITQMALVLLLLVAMTSACAEFQRVVRTANDIAMDLCMLTAQEHPEVVPDGWNPRSLCLIPAVLDVFLGEVRSGMHGQGVDALRRAGAE